jgi:hypothetical protein
MGYGGTIHYCEMARLEAALTIRPRHMLRYCAHKISRAVRVVLTNRTFSLAVNIKKNVTRRNNHVSKNNISPSGVNPKAQSNSFKILNENKKHLSTFEIKLSSGGCLI